MNSVFTFLAIMSFAALSMCVSADGKTPDFSGTWVLDASASKLNERDRIRELTLTVTQNAAEIRVDSALKLIPNNPAMEGGPAIRPLEQNISNTYRFNGEENKGEVPTPIGPQAATLKAKVEGPKLLLSQTYGDPVIIAKEIWTLSADGKTLTVERKDAPGAPSTLVFHKK
jgi:hypothetical protein